MFNSNVSERHSIFNIYKLFMHFVALISVYLNDTMVNIHLKFSRMYHLQFALKNK